MNHQYHFKTIEQKWQKYWEDNRIYHVEIDNSRPKYYVLDMFPYPSGAGLHVGHPLGYIASDIYARYKRLKGFNVLHPMGYDSFGLPAEQYAIQTGQHPAITTEKNIKRYREQLNKIGFSFDWERAVKTSDPAYYRWTQWIFLQFFNAWYNQITDKAEPIETLIRHFEKEGNVNIKAATTCNIQFTAKEWKNFSEEKQQEILLEYRLAYIAETTVNWCPELGTVLANDEVKDGLSIRGGYPVVQKKMKQWIMRITAYAERLLNDLEKIDWPEPLKEIQRNWIGKSEGALVKFKLQNSSKHLDIFTTRPDTIFGVTFMVVAPEHPIVEEITTEEQKKAVEEYIQQTLRKTERDRLSNTKNISGVFTGAYAIHPFSGEKIPVWISDYVLASYGTGAVMAVPAHDSRDYAFAKHFKLPIKQVVEGGNINEEAYDAKQGKLIHSDFLNGMEVPQAIQKAIEEIEKKQIGKRQINYRLRDAVFSRQRYWGEPIPIYFKNGIPYPVDEKDLPLKLPEIDKYLPTDTGEPPLARAKNWTYKGYPLETNTMPGWAGSSWYYLRYEDPHNNQQFVGKEAVEYWQNVDFYVGGAEHATGHLLYFRFWTKFLYDLGYIPFDEPAKKLINQGMIQGVSKFVYRIKNTNQFVSFHLKDNYDVIPIHVDISLTDGNELNIEAFKKWRKEFENAEFILEDGKYICGSEIEKMSKSKFNVVNPDELIEQYGADTLRLYEMFLGPIEQHKPWDTKGIEGTHRFLKKLWRLFHTNDQFDVTQENPTPEELKILHKTLKKVTEDIERFSLNTVVSEFMICVNELHQIKCKKRAILEPLIVAVSPYVPHIAEEIWHKLGNSGSIIMAAFPKYDEKYLKENTHVYPVSFNGKMRFKLELPVELSKEQIEQEVLNNEQAQKWLSGKSPKKVIVVPKKIVNVVV